jgi:hypothetical protein
MWGHICITPTVYLVADCDDLRLNHSTRETYTRCHAHADIAR